MAAIIFDFDGTLADSFDYVADFLAKEAGKSPLNETQRQSLKGMSMAAMARRFGFNWWTILNLFLIGRREMHKSVADVKPFPGLQDIIVKLHAEGHELFLMSSNNVRNIHKFLHHYSLHTFFLEIYGSVGMFSKAPALRRLIKKQKLDAKTVVYVGDELRDIEAAQSVGVKAVAVSWGFAREQDLKNSNPTAFAETPADLMRILENI